MLLQSKTWLIVVGLSLLGILSHLVPHDMGVSTVGAIGMLASAYLTRRLLMWPILATVFVVDAIHGFYALLAMSFVYLAHVLAAFAVKPILGSVTLKAVVGAGIVSAVTFYVVSNLTPIAMGYYPMSLDGWITCYVNGLPFLFRGVLANVVFGAAFFGVIWIVRESFAHRIAASQRN